jgi:hypothetical protein
MNRPYLAVVSFEFMMVVEAESLEEARKVAREHAHEELDNLNLEPSIVVDSNPSHIPGHFDSTYPYGGDGRVTVGELRARQEAKTDPSELAPEGT